MASKTIPRAHWILWGLLGAFFLRVVGQALVAFFGVTFLPPMEEWFSGILPYPQLLVSQLLILALLLKICLDVSGGHGYFSRHHPRLPAFLDPFGRIYLGLMILRYIYRMSMHPEARWTGGTIPIAFHCVLATFLLILSQFQKQLAPIATTKVKFE